MRPSFRAIVVVATTALSASAAAAPVSGEVFVKLPGATLKADAAHWGEWIADVERPQAADGKYGAVGGMHRNDALTDVQRSQAADGNGQVDALTDGLLIVRYMSATARPYPPGNTKYSSVKLTRARPQDGAVVVRLAQPWPACKVGERFNGVYLTIGATHKYRLDGLEVASCSPQQVAFVYARAKPE